MSKVAPSSSQSNEDFEWEKPMFGVLPLNQDLDDVFKGDEDEPVIQTGNEDNPDEENLENNEEDDDFPTLIPSSDSPEEENNEEEEDADAKKKPKQKQVEEPEEEDEPEANEEGDKVFSVILGELKAKNLFQYAEIPDGDVPEEEFFGIIDDEVEGRAVGIIEELVTNMDDDGKAYMRFLKSGGSSQEFFRLYSNLNTPALDLEDEAHQEMAVKQYMTRVLKESESEIEDMLTVYKESGKLEKKAKEYYAKLQAMDEKAKADLAANAVAQKEAQKAGYKKFQESIQEAVQAADTIKSFSFAKVNKKAFVEKITNPTIKVEGTQNQYQTPLQAKLSQIFSNPDKSDLLLLGKFLLEDDLDPKDVVVKTTTKKTQSAKEKLEQARKTTGTKAAAKLPNKINSVADFF